MKAHPLLLAVAALMAISACLVSVLGDRVPGEGCPLICGFNFAPVCAISWGDRFRTFDNNCSRLAYNCRNKETYEFVCDGTCIFSQNDEAPKSRGLLPTSLLCSPRKG